MPVRDQTSPDLLVRCPSCASTILLENRRLDLAEKVECKSCGRNGTVGELVAGNPLRTSRTTAEQ
jgi:hypothetical protein